MLTPCRATSCCRLPCTCRCRCHLLSPHAVLAHSRVQCFLTISTVCHHARLHSHQACGLCICHKWRQRALNDSRHHVVGVGGWHNRQRNRVLTHHHYFLFCLLRHMSLLWSHSSHTSSSPVFTSPHILCFHTYGPSGYTPCVNTASFQLACTYVCRAPMLVATRACRSTTHHSTQLLSSICELSLHTYPPHGLCGAHSMFVGWGASCLACVVRMPSLLLGC